MPYDLDKQLPVRTSSGTFEGFIVGDYIVTALADILCYSSPSEYLPNFDDYTSYEVVIHLKDQKENNPLADPIHPYLDDKLKDFNWSCYFQTMGFNCNSYSYRYCSFSKLKEIIKDLEELENRTFQLEINNETKYGGFCKKCKSYDKDAPLDINGECYCYIHC